MRCNEDICWSNVEVKQTITIKVHIYKYKKQSIESDL